jgi:hypothetical protein
MGTFGVEDIDPDRALEEFYVFGDCGFLGVRIAFLCFINNKPIAGGVINRLNIQVLKIDQSLVVGVIFGSLFLLIGML